MLDCRQKTSKPSTVPVVATVTPVTPAEMVPLPVHPCEFPLGACVKTARFGPALVVKFRPLDGIYQVCQSRVSSLAGLGDNGMGPGVFTTKLVLDVMHVKTKQLMATFFFGGGEGFYPWLEVGGWHPGGCVPPRLRH